MAVLVGLRDRLASQGTSASDGRRRALDFEGRVEKAIRDAGLRPVSTKLGVPVDFMVDVGGRTIGVEAKAPAKAVPRVLAPWLSTVAKGVDGVDEIVLVLPSVSAPLSQLSVDPVRIVDPDGLRALLKEAKANGSSPP